MTDLFQGALGRASTQIQNAIDAGQMTETQGIAALADVTNALASGSTAPSPAATPKPPTGRVNATDVELLVHALKREGRSEEEALREAAGTYQARESLIAAE